MFNMGLQEMIVLGVIALLVIGPKQLPEVARVIARLINEFKSATSDLTSSLTSVKHEAQDLANQTQSYMHKQKAEFEKKMKEQLELDDSHHDHHSADDNFDDLDEEFRPAAHDHSNDAHEDDCEIVDEKRPSQGGVHQPEEPADTQTATHQASDDQAEASNENESSDQSKKGEA
jgi:Tat protein translocase TatB subunit